jgi:RHS repeat-associated protein
MDSLDRVLMPPSTTGGTDREVWSFAYRRPVAGCDDLSGVMEYAQLPTGAVLAWTYQGQTAVDMPKVVTVQGRTTGYMVSGIIWQPVGRKTYTWNGYEAIQIDTMVNVAAEGAPVDWRTEDRVIQYRRYFWGTDFGLPYTTTSRATPVTAPNPDGSTANRYLSSETFDCNPTTGVCGLDRVTYVRYEMDEMIGDGCTLIDPCRIERNRRVHTERTRYVSDGGTYADANYSRFDGLGHYRQTTTAGTFDSGNVRTASTEFNPGVGNYAVNSSGNRVAGHTMLPSTAAWLLETFPETSVTEGSVTEKRQYCFDAGSGLLLRTRVMGSTSPVASDFLTVYTRASTNTESLGSVTLEQRFGGNMQALDLGAICSLTLPTDQIRIEHTYADGSLKTSQYQTSAGAGLTFFSVNNLIDLNTGRVTQSTDSGGVATAYDYDLRGRLKKIRPLGANNDGATEYVYTNYTVPTAPAQVEMLEWNRAGNSVLGRSKWIFDQFGRVSKEKRLLANGTWNTRRTEYDGAGRRTHVSEAEALDTPVYRTTYSEFDADGRPRLITPPDHTAGIDTRLRFAYYGSRLAYRTIKVKTASGYADATTVETYDRQGRLWKVTEPSGASGADVSTTYGYDAGNRLKSVSTAAAEGTQTRTFTYDGRGVLVSETHPEKGVSGNGTVTYSSFDASGRPTRKVDGSFDLRFLYDRAERLTQINQGGARLWKEFTFGVSGVENGKLKTAIRHNHHDLYAINVIVTESYTYGGAGGRVSQRDTGTSEGTIFRQNFTYDDRGRTATLGYPFCPAGSTCAPLTGLGTLTNTYTNGFLTSIPGYAPSITYHPNGLVQDVSFPNGAHWLQDNDPWSMPRPSQIRTTGTSPTWTSGAYAYDGAGNITTVGSDSYLYDKVGRVTSGTALSGTRSQTYTYDSFGNAKTITTAGGYLANVTMTPSASTNRLAEHPYDSSGNVTSTHQYNSAGAVTSTNFYTWRYDPMGMAAHVISNDGGSYNWTHVYTADEERLWAYDLVANISYWRVRDLSGKVLTEFVKNNAFWTGTTSYVHRDGSLLASYSAGRSFPLQYHAIDHLGSIGQTFRSDAGGPELYRHAYYPFGDEATVTTDGEVMRFTGHERENNGTDYMHARFYGTRRGRFLSVDPRMDTTNALKKPQTWNRYTYADNNPIQKVDPDGRQAVIPQPAAGPLLPLNAALHHVQQMQTNDAYRDALVDQVQTSLLITELIVTSAFNIFQNAVEPISIFHEPALANTPQKGRDRPRPGEKYGPRPQSEPPVPADPDDPRQPPKHPPTADPQKHDRFEKWADLLDKLKDVFQ